METRLDMTSKMNKDFESEFVGLNSGLLLDIYDVHNCFLFSNNHLQTYNGNNFQTDIIKNGTQYLGTNFINKYLKYFSCQFGYKFYRPDDNKLFCKYLINDDIFAIFRYHFAVSNIVHQIQNKGIQLHVKAFVIPKSIVSVYDHSITFKYSINTIEQYLFTKNIHNYIKIRIKENKIKSIIDIIKTIEQNYDIDDIKFNDTNKLIFIVDRRRINTKQDTLYIVSNNKSDKNNFSELHFNYFIGFNYRLASNKCIL